MISYSATPDTFYQQNHQELLAVFQSLGIRSRDDLHDYSQIFYCRLPYIIRMYNPQQSKFSTYIFEVVKGLIRELGANRHKQHTFIAMTDEIMSKDDKQEIGVRIEDFKRFCIQTGSHSTRKVLDEIQVLLQDERGFTGVSYQTFVSYRQSYLRAESV